MDEAAIQIWTPCMSEQNKRIVGIILSARCISVYACVLIHVVVDLLMKSMNKSVEATQTSKDAIRYEIRMF